MLATAHIDPMKGHPMSDPTLPPEMPEQPPVPPASPGDYGTQPPPPSPPPPPSYGAPPPPAPPISQPNFGAADRPFSVGDAFNWGWAKFQQNASPIIIATLIYIVVLAVIEVIAYFVLGGLLLSSTNKITIDQTTGAITTSAGTGLIMVLIFAALAAFVFWVIIAVVQAGIIRGTLDIADGKRVEIADFFKFEKISQVVIAGVIVALAEAVGTFLCYIPALIVAFFTPFYLFFILDKNLAPWDAIMASVRLVSTNIGSMFVLIIGVIVAYIVGAVLCIIGLIVTMPVALLALTFAYRKFQNEPVAA